MERIVKFFALIYCKYNKKQDQIKASKRPVQNWHFSIWEIVNAHKIISKTFVTTQVFRLKVEPDSVYIRNTRIKPLNSN